MKSLFILEHPEHFLTLKKHYAQGDQFVAMTPYASFPLEQDGIDFRRPEDYYNHEDFWAVYQEETSKLIDFIIECDKQIALLNPMFKENDFKPFMLGLNKFKTPQETVKVLVFFLNRIIKQETPDRIMIVKDKNFVKTSVSEMIFHAEDQICLHLLHLLKKKHEFKLEIIEIPKKIDVSTFNLRRYEHNDFFQFIKHCKKVFIRQDQTRMVPANNDKKRILALDCLDVESLKEELLLEGFDIEALPADKIRPFTRNHKGKISTGFIRWLETDAVIQDLLTFEDVYFYDVIREHMVFYAQTLESLWNKYNDLKNFIKEQNLDMVICNSLSSYETESLLVSDICRKEDIAHVCWIHGGYGGYKSMEGYDLTDFTFADYYFTYGDALNRNFQNDHPNETIGHANAKRLLEHYPKNPIKYVTAGAPYFERQYQSYQRPNNARKKILFIQGEIWIHNEYYMGGNMPYTYAQKWRETQAILKTLIDFQHDYDITFKLYPCDHTGEAIYREFLDQNQGNNIKIIRRERSIDELITEADLTISTWISTTFFQTALTDGDQFLFDPADLTDEAREIVGQCFYFSDEIISFCRLLNEYLKNGQFYQKDKTRFRQEYLDSAYKDERAQKVAEILNQIINQKQAVELVGNV